MQHGWMFEVLEDLRDYAAKNDLVAVHEALRLTSTVVNAELQGAVRASMAQASDNSATVLQIAPLPLPVKYQA